ncbi:PBP1A family penicillin-binding protein [Patescibacteria group bacterium]|nr:PBP1A family penicillin-binding protein [Patescibacteria group bacterium]
MAERKFYRKTFDKKSLKKEGRKRRITVYILFSLLILFILTILSGIGVFIYYAKDLPRPEKFTERSFIESTKIYDRTGEVLLYELYGETKREIIPLSEMSNNIKNAVIATEDARFYSHHGIDFFGILRAFKLNLNSGRPTYGGSTISQQLIRSTFLTLEKSIARKVKELILTLEMERRYSKDQILEWYLNQVPMGINLYGVQSSSKTYFNKPASELTIAEAAILVASIKAPSYYSPFGNHLDELYGRKDYVIDRMAQENFITEEQAEEAKRQELIFAKVSQTIKAPHFVLHIQEYLFETYGKNFLEERGYRVYTTLDWELQKAAEKAIEEGAERNKKYKAYNAALVAIDPQTGEVLSMVGSANWFGESYPEGCTSGKNCMLDPKLNVSTYRIGRQPGSAFKPFVYVTAFQNGYNSKNTVIDEETNFGVWGGKEYIPQNYDGLFRGEVTLRSALAQSLNVPAVRVLLELSGLQESINTARRCGVTTLKESSNFYGPSIVLGGGEVRLIDMVSAYGVFATEGTRLPPTSILRIEDSEGNIIEQKRKTPKKILDEEPTRILNSILSDNNARAPMFGYNSALYFPNYQVAVKTGTTNSYRDAWTIGYTPNISVGVWVGNNDNTEMSHKPSVTIAGPIWRSFMEAALNKLPKQDFTPPLPEPNPEEKTEE